jgi:hypothetical protein
MSGPKNLSYRNRLARRHAKDRRVAAQQAREIKALKLKLASMVRDLSRAERRIRKLEEGVAA